MSMFFLCVHIDSMAWALFGLRNCCWMRQDESDDKSGKQILVTEVLLQMMYVCCHFLCTVSLFDELVTSPALHNSSK